MILKREWSTGMISKCMIRKSMMQFDAHEVHTTYARIQPAHAERR